MKKSKAIVLCLRRRSYRSRWRTGGNCVMPTMLKRATCHIGRGANSRKQAESRSLCRLELGILRYRSLATFPTLVPLYTLHRADTDRNSEMRILALCMAFRMNLVPFVLFQPRKISGIAAIKSNKFACFLVAHNIKAILWLAHRPSFETKHDHYCSAAL